MEKMSSIELALKNESVEMAFYEAQAKRAMNPVTKALFQELANDERDHHKQIEALHGLLVKGGVWPEDVKLDVAGTNVLRTLEEVERSPVKAVDRDADEVAALKKGIEFEKAGTRFYSMLAELCESAKEKEFFEFLATVEADHLASIEDTLLYIEDPDAWNARREEFARG